ncbi:DUF1360 domain-containing protein [Kribbella albertanoniae]|uniref:DUF1360 domain-containing protein n=2 Tax=Kribbella albertanoniae TaxID=1266829 RepID=A0A4R4QB84_9ACTN|nr:DUF1360 domain-containing protein [Kribbella albertanoniae]
MDKVFDAVESEADQYRQGAVRPLGGYAVVMAVFAGLVGLAGGVAALRGTTGRRMSPYELMLMTAGTHKLSRLVTKDAVTSPLRVPFTRYREPGGPAEVMEEVRERGQLRHAVGELLTCPFCVSVWIATGFSIGFLFVPGFTRMVASALTAVAGADCLQLIYARLQQAAESDT